MMCDFPSVPGSNPGGPTNIPGAKMPWVFLGTIFLGAIQVFMALVCDARQRLTLKLRYNKSFENKVSPTTAIEMH
jgi:hypothetical protein